MEYKRKNEGGFWISWGLIIALFILGLSPIAVILMLVKLFKKDRRELEEIPPLQTETRYTVDTRINRGQLNQQVLQGQPGAQGRAGTSSQTGGGPSARQPRQESRPAEAVRQITRSPAPKKSTIRALTIGGGILAVVGLMSIGDLMDVFTFSDLMFTISTLVGGGAMLAKGWQIDRDFKRYAKYLPMIGDRDAVSVDELARTTGVSAKQVERDLDDMVEKGYFGDGAYLNRELKYLFRSNGADRAWQEQQRQAQASTPAEAAEGYSGILRNIRRVNDEIADPVLSAKIDQLEDITARIFRAVEQDPVKAEKIDTFLNYYLPTTQKLLDSYAQFEAAGVEGENLSQAKARISSTMDMILQGFSRQLDQLYQADAMDVDTDIRVMESMFRRDTRTVSDDFHVGGAGKGSTASGGAPGSTSGGDSGRTVPGGASGKAASGGAAQSGRFGQSFEEDFGGVLAQRMPEEE